MNEDKDGMVDFFMVKKNLLDAYYGGELNFSEVIIRLWLSRWADKRGVVTIKSHKYLANQLPKELGLKPNTVGKYLKSLRSQKWLWYEIKQGVRSGYRVQLLPWPIANHKALTAEDFFKKEKIICEEKSEPGIEPQVVPEHVDYIHMSKPTINSQFKGLEIKSISEIITSSYNDRDNDNNTSIVTSNKKEYIPVVGFRVNTLEESMLVRFARLCGDQYMNSYIGRYKKYGEKALKAMERAEVRYKEANLIGIKNKPAFFNSLISEELR